MSSRKRERAEGSSGGRWSVRRTGVSAKGQLLASIGSKGIFVGPSVEGGDEEYVKVVSGQVNAAKPSFA
ncbi:hypothetical protein [Cohnella caldifontis]|uniref:hypothetical protein n=1 Tax=Cohnella caldifontis TaxID=3027471 RepID=UPI0023EC538C|nr:hypothetical protein [Cohnella sp. YIM B05605]